MTLKIKLCSKANSAVGLFLNGKVTVFRWKERSSDYFLFWCLLGVLDTSRRVQQGWLSATRGVFSGTSFCCKAPMWWVLIRNKQQSGWIDRLKVDFLIGYLLDVLEVHNCKSNALKKGFGFEICGESAQKCHWESQKLPLCRTKTFDRHGLSWLVKWPCRIASLKLQTFKKHQFSLAKSQAQNGSLVKWFSWKFFFLRTGFVDSSLFKYENTWIRIKFALAA